MSWKATPKSSNALKMQLIAEVSPRLAEPKSCQGLLYAPLSKPQTYRQTQRYVFEFSGDEAALTDFIRKVLVDDVCQDLAVSGDPVYEGSVFHLDYGMKPGALDHEKETILVSRCIIGVLGISLLAILGGILLLTIFG